MKNIDLNKIKYLSFEGGGGRGQVYLGAIRALENKLKLNRVIDINSPLDDDKKRPIKGVSGASAGAITAFMLAIGMNSKEIENEFNKTKYETFKRETVFLGLFTLKKKIKVSLFELFFDKPNGNSMKAVVSNSNLQQYDNYNSLGSKGIRLTLGLAFSNLIKWIISIYVTFKKKFFKSSMIFERFFDSKDDTNEYLYSLFFNRGLFLANTTRTYFSSLIDEYLYPQIDWKEILKPYLPQPIQNIDGSTSYFPSLKILPEGDILREIILNIDDIIANPDFGVNPKPADKLTFREFLFLTGVDLIITGTNVTKARSLYLSFYHTPDFPIVDAVSISMNIPIVFKPIYVDYLVDSKKNSSYSEKYKGLWVDGGMLNNFPIHAFDDLEEVNNFPFRNKNYTVNIAKTKANSVRPFCDCVLGFRLKGAPETRSPLDPDALVLGHYAGELMNAFMYSGGDGQIRTPLEEANTIYLDTFTENEKDEEGKYIDDKPYWEISVTDFASANLDFDRGNIKEAGYKNLLIDLAKDRTLKSITY